MSKVVGLMILLGIIAACAHVEPPSIPPQETALTPQDAWTGVLQRAVDEQGRINFALLARERGDLERYVAYIAQASPDAQATDFVGRLSVLAYHLNTYNALAMYRVVSQPTPPRLTSFFGRVRFFVLTRHKIGGHPLSLYTYENAEIRPLSEPRVHFALNCMVVGCPRLPREPFQADKLDQQLEAAAVAFFNDPKHVQVDAAHGMVRFSAILRFYKKDFVNEWAAPSLIAYANQYREEKIPADLKVKFLPYDWTLNMLQQ